jgi:SAM-dependent methyltransferase
MTATWDNKQAWATYEGSTIPSKTEVSVPLDIITNRLKQNSDQLSILDLACGSGKFLLDLIPTLNVKYAVGVDINEEAIQIARVESIDLKDVVTFHIGDVLTKEIGYGKFDLVTLQLVISVIGTLQSRRELLLNARRHLKSSGILYMSASGISDDVNENYRHLYGQDEQLTGEKYSYYSRDQQTGKILYLTHHFCEKEIFELLRDCGFCKPEIKQIKESSSRRPNEAAYFLYVTAKVDQNKQV